MEGVAVSRTEELEDAAEVQRQVLQPQSNTAAINKQEYNEICLIQMP